MWWLWWSISIITVIIPLVPLVAPTLTPSLSGKNNTWRGEEFELGDDDGEQCGKGTIVGDLEKCQK